MDGFSLALAITHEREREAVAPCVDHVTSRVAFFKALVFSDV
jgi:hypothetical protein